MGKQGSAVRLLPQNHKKGGDHMSTKGVESLIKRAVEDSEFRQRLASNPEEVFPEFDLTAEEQEAVKRVQKRLSLEEKELEQIGAVLDVVPFMPWLP